jgi:hypothetical protein
LDSPACTSSFFFFSRNHLILVSLFFSFLQESLICSSLAMRKKSLFVLKKFTKDYFLLLKRGMNSSGGRLSSDKAWEVSKWEKWFLVMETIDESEIHLLTVIFTLSTNVLPPLLLKFSLRLSSKK